ncbi:MAG TPA: hypothetical protein EYP56_22015 [Planctomycetaceae bacterium]|nr:hypothetical protein [Planctomycetaceae bacterium]HIQ22963.1 hypothetical protein [Planctomycetota bacterium]
MGSEPLRRLRDLIDQELMALDQALCERARQEGVARRDIAVVDCSLAAMEAMISAFSQDGHLWSQFQREVRGPRDVVFDQVYAKALTLGRAKADREATPETLRKAMGFCDAEGWAKRINAMVGRDAVDGLTVHAVAYVLGGHPKLRKEFIGWVEGRH